MLSQRKMRLQYRYDTIQYIFMRFVEKQNMNRNSEETVTATVGSVAMLQQRFSASAMSYRLDALCCT